MRKKLETRGIKMRMRIKTVKVIKMKILNPMRDQIFHTLIMIT